MSDYDAIVIGSGAGGEKVLVPEQHDRPGGWTHPFMADDATL